MDAKTYLVVTSISSPNAPLISLAQGAKQAGFEFLVIGDKKSPDSFELERCRFYSLVQQQDLKFNFSKLCLTGKYSRKNIGYLIALAEDAEIIVETDDDNFPLAPFWNPRERYVRAREQDEPAWTNVYRYFTDANIWPRGFPLQEINASLPPIFPETSSYRDTPIQQGLADGNPDVDAIYRLTRELPQYFRNDPPVVLGQGAWCPFNSQNTTWFRVAAPLLYLPTYCSFRMTDIWRSFVAQRIAWENSWKIAFHSPTVFQERNEHDLLTDFLDEIPGYLNYAKFTSLLRTLQLRSGVNHIPDNMMLCYRTLIGAKLIGDDELSLLSAWLDDISSLKRS